MPWNASRNPDGYRSPAAPPRRRLAFAAGHFLVLALNCRLVSIRIRTKTGHRIKTSFISGIPQ